MKLTKKQTYISLAVLGFLVAVGAGATVAPLLHPGDNAQLASRFSVGTLTSGSLFSVAGGNGHLKIEPETGQTGKTLGVGQNALAVGDIRVGDFDETNVTGAFTSQTGLNFSDIEDLLQYPSSVVSNNVNSLAPQQSVNVHGKVVMEGVKAQNIATASDPLCLTPAGTITRCNLGSGFKWIKTGWGSCIDTATPINNTTTNINDHNVPFSCQVVDVYNQYEEVSATDFQFLEAERKVFVDLSSYFLETFSAPKAHAAQIQTIEDSDGEEWIYCSALPSPPTGGFTGVKSMNFACYDVNACSVVDDQNCIDTIGAKPVYQSSCLAPASDTYHTCSTLPGNHPSCVPNMGVCMRPDNGDANGNGSGDADYGSCVAVASGEGPILGDPGVTNDNILAYQGALGSAEVACAQHNNTSEATCEAETGTTSASSGSVSESTSYVCNWVE